MHLVQIFLPLQDNSGTRFPGLLFTEVRDELVERFGGLTAYSRTPVEGLWKPSEQRPPSRDAMVIYEVMAPSLDETWWRRFRENLERRFRQESILVRANEVTVI